MKKYIFKLSIILVTLTIVTGCQKEYPIMFDAASSVVGFSKTTLSINENATSGSFNIYLGAKAGTAATDVTLEVSVEGIANPAVEGTDFTVSSKTVSVPVGVTAVTVTPIDNNIFQGNKQVNLIIVSNSKNYPVADQDTLTVTLIDDEHPLKAWIGTYKVAAASYGNPGAWDEEWTVTTSAVAGKLDQLQMVGLGNGSTIPITATIDKTNLTISFKSGQPLGTAYGSGNGAVSLYYGTADIIGQVLAGDYITAAMLSASSSVKITGTLNLNGTILVDKMGMILTDYNWPWDVFNTTWTKQ
jgi:hypothetical protein